MDGFNLVEVLRRLIQRDIKADIWTRTSKRKLDEHEGDE